MKLLLDTHIWLWLLDEQKRLGRKTLPLLKDEENELWLSPISLWEALTLHQKRRIQIGGDIRLWIKRALAGTKEAVLTHEIVSAASGLQFHKDPSDRIITATAIVLGLTLVTADKRLLQRTDIQTLANS